MCRMKWWSDSPVNEPVIRYKLIHCFLPLGRAAELIERLHAEKGIADTFYHHARGGGISTRKGLESFQYQEREIATLLVPEQRADEIFEFVYFAAGLNQPHAGMVIMERALLARPLNLDWAPVAGNAT